MCFVSPGKAYAPEFYYDTYNPLWQNRPRVYGFKLQWTQMNPNAVDRIVAYRLGLRQVGEYAAWWFVHLVQESSFSFPFCCYSSINRLHTSEQFNSFNTSLLFLYPSPLTRLTSQAISHLVSSYLVSSLHWLVMHWLATEWCHLTSG